MNKILQGDCIQELRKLPDRSIDLLLTDPPYGDARGYGRGNRTIANNENPLMGLMALAACWRIQKRNTAAFFFLDVKHFSIVERFVTQYTDYRVKDWIVWDKVHIGMGYGFRKRYELILVLEKGMPRYKNLGFSNVLNISRTTTVEHPHKKPVQLLRSLIEQCTEVGDVVLDPFLGSGTTAVAAAQLKRRYIGIECKAEYVRVTRDRLKALR